MIVKAADRFHVAPWVLLERGQAWVEIALATVSAETRAANEVQRRAERRARMERSRSGGGRGR